MLNKRLARIEPEISVGFVYIFADVWYVIVY